MSFSSVMIFVIKYKFKTCSEKAFASSEDILGNFTSLGNSLGNDQNIFLAELKVNFMFTITTLKHVEFIPSQQGSHQNNINIINLALFYHFVANFRLLFTALYICTLNLFIFSLQNGLWCSSWILQIQMTFHNVLKI